MGIDCAAGSAAGVFLGDADHAGHRARHTGRESRTGHTARIRLSRNRHPECCVHDLLSDEQMMNDECGIGVSMIKTAIRRLALLWLIAPSLTSAQSTLSEMVAIPTGLFTMGAKEGPED